MNLLKRSIAMGCILLIICCLFFTNVNSAKAETTAQAVMISYPRAGDANDNGKWGHPAQVYLNGWKTGSTNVTTVHTMGSYDGTVVYCVEPGRERNTGDRYTKYDESFWDNLSEDYNSRLTPVEIRTLLGRVLYYGYQGSVSMDWVSQNGPDADKISHIMATQILVWEVIVGERNIYFDHMDTGSKDPMKEYVQKEHPLYDRFCYYYDVMEKNIKRYLVYPSFFGKTGSDIKVSLQWDGSKYAATLKDTNNAVTQYAYKTSDSRVTIKPSGSDTLLISSTQRLSDVTVTAYKNVARKTVLIWSDGIYSPTSGMQDAITYGANIVDPIALKISVDTQAGDLQITKSAEDGNVENVSFTITGNKSTQSGKTNAKGVLTIKNLAPGSYVIKEDNVVPSYITPKSQTVTIKNNETTKVTFQNTLKRGSVKVYKKSEDEKIEGISFRLKGTSLSGQEIDLKATTNEQGVAVFDNVLISGEEPYQIEEEDIPSWYVPIEPKEVVIKENECTQVQFQNVLRRGNVIIQKESEDGEIENCSFHLYGTSLSGKRMDETAKTNEEGKAVFENILISGEEPYTVEEIEVLDKYIVPESQMVFVLDTQDNQVTFENKLKRLSVFVHKQNEKGQPLQGAQFGLFVKGESDPIFIQESDEQGDCAFLEILPGDYLLMEMKAPEGYECSKEPIEFSLQIENGDAYITIPNQKIPEVQILKEEPPKETPQAPNPTKAPDTSQGTTLFADLLALVVFGLLALKKNLCEVK